MQLLHLDGLDAGCHGHVKKQCLLLWHGDINHIMQLGADEAGGIGLIQVMPPALC